MIKAEHDSVRPGHSHDAFAMVVRGFVGASAGELLAVTPANSQIP